MCVSCLLGLLLELLPLWKKKRRSNYYLVISVNFPSVFDSTRIKSKNNLSYSMYTKNICELWYREIVLWYYVKKFADCLLVVRIRGGGVVGKNICGTRNEWISARMSPMHRHILHIHVCIVRSADQYPPYLCT